MEPGHWLAEHEHTVRFEYLHGPPARYLPSRRQIVIDAGCRHDDLADMLAWCVTHAALWCATCCTTDWP